MTQIKWLVLGILVSVCSVCFSTDKDNEDEAEDNVWRSQHHSMSMYTVVVSKGCTYLAGFIQSVYIRSHHNSKHADCDWQRWVRTKCTSYHIPSEICAGLISCGTACALSTLKAPSDMMHNCNVSAPRSSASLFGKRAFSYRGHIDHNTMNLCSTTRTHSLSFAFGRRDAGDNHPPNVTESLQKKTDNGPHQGQGSVSNGSLKRWCRAFSRYIRGRFHFNEVKFVHSSPYWLVDVYKIGPKFGVPLMHTHGLVGCGMEYALSALNAPSWMARFYRMPNK